MLLGGDEMGRTQGGNNNAYCHDNETSWFDWSLVDKNAALLRFVQYIIAFRLRHPAFMRPEFYTGKDSTYNAIPDIRWYTETLEAPNWEKIDKMLALHMNGTKAAQLADRDDNDFFIMFNAGDTAVTFNLAPAGKNKRWYREVDTALPSPNDISPIDAPVEIDIQSKYPVKALSMVVLMSKTAEMK
jgi:glycogen operon protein